MNTMKTKMETIKVWCFGAGGKLVLGNVDVRSMEHARKLAREWNRGNVNRIEIISNQPVAAHATAICAV